MEWHFIISALGLPIVPPQHLKGISATHRHNKGTPGSPLPHSHRTLLLTLEDSNHLGTLKERETTPLTLLPK